MPSVQLEQIKIELKLDVGWSDWQSQIDEAKAWCNEYWLGLEYNHIYHWSSVFDQFYFNNKEMAAMFKLRWG